MNKEERYKKAWITSKVKRSLLASGCVCEVCGWGIYVPLVLGGMDGRNPINVHHMKPVSAGGSLEKENAIKLCPNHHALCHAMWPTQYGRYFGPITKEKLIEELKKIDDDPKGYVRDRNERYAIEALEVMKL